MARPKKSGVDYFPHDVNSTSSRTLFTLESRFGNDGYAFWFKLLEIIGTQNNFYYDCKNVSNWLFLLAKTRVNEVSATEMLDTLAQVDAIDAELWRQKVIWVQKFVERLSDVFKKRGTETPIKPSFCTENHQKIDVIAPESTQSKVKESKVNIPPISPKGIDIRFDMFWKAYPKKVGKGAAEKSFKKYKPDDSLLALMLEALGVQKQSDQWKRDDGQYIPNPSTWLNQKRWEDEIKAGRYRKLD
jgi:hypothetical protein